MSFPSLPFSHLYHLGTLYKISDTKNAEVRLRWYQLALAEPASEAATHFAPEGANWIVGKQTGVIVGRMKFCRDVFRAVFKVDKLLAQTKFEAAKNSFHPIARKLIEKASRIVAPS